MRALMGTTALGWLILGLAAGACSSDRNTTSYDGDGASGDADGDGDGDGDGDSDADADGDADGDSDSDTDTGEVDQTLIWIANSEEGTVSKIDTRDLVELGRYWVREDGSGSPSRTSVSAGGDVVVAARTGGVTKIYGDTSLCQDTNGTPGIQTSGGGGEILDWDVEECRAWHTPMSYSSMRALAFTSGDYNQQTNTWENTKVWATGSTSAGDDFTTPLHVLLIDGDSGEVEHLIELDDVPVGNHGHGGYGGVVDSENNFWIAQIYSQKLIKVSFDDLSWETWDEPVGVYGITYDEQGRIFTCNERMARFDPGTETWETGDQIEVGEFYGLTGGCMADGEGLIWNSVNDTLYAIDTETLAVVDQIALPAQTMDGKYWGVAIDTDGFVWTIPRYGSDAYRVDPVSAEYQVFSGLVGAYTYSDMTGHTLQLAIAPE